MSSGSGSLGGCAGGAPGGGENGDIGDIGDIGDAGGIRRCCSRFRMPQTVQPSKARTITRSAMIPSSIWIIPRSALDRTVTVKEDVAELPAASVTVRVAAYAPGRA